MLITFNIYYFNLDSYNNNNNNIFLVPLRIFKYIYIIKINKRRHLGF